VIDPGRVPLSHVQWRGAVRIIRSAFPPIDLFEDIADPADWPLLISAEQKTNPRLMESIGELDRVPPGRRVGGAGASFIMAPFVHVSAERASRFSDGSFGVLYAGRTFEVALMETMHHHGRFMASTEEAPGWTSQFREIILDLDGALHDLRGGEEIFEPLLDPDDYRPSQAFALALRRAQSEGIVYPSVRCTGGECAGLFYPDLAANAVQGRHLDYRWNGRRVDFVRDLSAGQVFGVVD
jgi:hypothetical protein